MGGASAYNRRMTTNLPESVLWLTDAEESAREHENDGLFESLFESEPNDRFVRESDIPVQQVADLDDDAAWLDAMHGEAAFAGFIHQADHQ